MNEPKITDGMQEYPLASWRDFLSPPIMDFFATSPAYIYRGQANWEWKLVSSLNRLEEKYPKRKNLAGSNPEFYEPTPFTEEEHLDAFRRAIQGRRGPNPPQLNDDECWALGQHHGLATPLLDWTRSPFVALFFAFAEEHIHDGEKNVEPEFRAVFALSTSDKVEELKFISPLCDDNYPLISQMGLFVKIPRHTDLKDLESYVSVKFRDKNKSAILKKYKIPNTDKDRHECLVALNKMNINYMTLIPDISGAALHVNSLWEPGHEDSIAYI